MKDFHDLRNYLRLDSSFDVMFKILSGTSNQKHPAQALDIGAGGVKVFSSRRLKKDMQLELFFHIDKGKGDYSVVSAMGRVMWSKEIKVDNQSLGRYEVGIGFEEIDIKDRDKIFQHVYRKLAAQERVRTLIRRVHL